MAKIRTLTVPAPRHDRARLLAVTERYACRLLTPKTRAVELVDQSALVRRPGVFRTVPLDTRSSRLAGT